MRALWARERSAMKTEGREPIRREMIGPCLAWRVLRKGSSWENDFLIHRKLVMMGIWGGPGGMLMAVVVLVVRERMMALIRRQTQAETRTRNHVSILW